MFGNFFNQLTGQNQQEGQNAGQQPPQGEVTEQPKEPGQTQQGTGSDFFSGLLNAAQEVGKVIGEKTQEGAGAVKSGVSTVADTTKSTAEGAGKLTKEQMENIASGISDFVGKAAGAFSQKKEGPVEVEEQITAVDSQGGKVQISSVSDGTTTATTVTQKPEGGDFFSGIMDAAKQVGQAISEKTQEGAGAVKSGALSAAETTKSTAEGGAQITKESLDKITSGIGDLIGKAAGALNLGEKKEVSAPAKPEENFGDSKPEIDDVEGEIGKVITGGYTTDKAPKTEEGFLSSTYNKGKEMASGAVERVQEGATRAYEGAQSLGESAKNTVVSGYESVKEGAQSLGETTKDTVSAGYERAKETGSSVLEDAQNLGQSAKDTVASGYESVKEGTQTLGESVKDTAVSGYESVKEGAQSGYEKTREGAQSLGESVKDTTVSGYESVKEGAQNLGDSAKDTVASGYQSVKEGAQTLGESVKDTAVSGYESVKEGAQSGYEKTREGAQSLGESAKDTVVSGYQSVKEGAQKLGESAKDTTVSGYELVKQGAQNLGESAKNTVVSGSEPVMDAASSASDSVQKGADSTVEGAKTFGVMVKDGAQTVFNSEELGTTASEKTKEAWDTVSAVRTEPDTVHHTVDEAFVKAGDFGGSVRDEHHSVVDSPKDKTSFAVGTTHDAFERQEVVEHVTDREIPGEPNLLRETARAVVDSMQELIEAVQDTAHSAAEVVRKRSHDAVGKGKELGETARENLSEIMGTIPVVTNDGLEDLGTHRGQETPKKEDSLPQEASRTSYNDFEDAAAEAAACHPRMHRRQSEMSDWEEEVIKEGNLSDEDEGMGTPEWRTVQNLDEEPKDLIHTLIDAVRSRAGSVGEYIRWASGEGHPVEEGSGVFYESALGVGTAFFQSAASFVEAVKEGTGAVVEGVMVAANEISEEAMYGPDRKSPERETRSWSPAPQAPRETMSVPKIIPSVEEILPVVTLDESQRSGSVRPHKENTPPGRLKQDSESDQDYEFVKEREQSRPESQVSDASWTDCEMRSRTSSTAKPRTQLKMPTPVFDLMEEEGSIAAPSTPTQTPHPSKMSKLVLGPNTVMNVHMEKSPEESEAKAHYAQGEFEQE